MDLIYFILSVLLRLSPAVRKVSRVTETRTKFRESDLVDLAFWLPLVGWISVSVQHVSGARWMEWRVRNVRAFYDTSNSNSCHPWNIDILNRGGNSPPRGPSPD
ncbi:MAG: hypothetical protein P8J27_00705 [Mariniblastus sp.]|nr:hypothetical protein [Mariniblastus sp.]